ncbi:hypothetical protein PU629_18280 [Pullulanibacillus sp. KACC 23026]|nr:hypothetical protein [Pullulanibacillus sp. KACC 23026]WEG12049.1 hypothetical protein PU629_18280 [Pullulanibacillus sp. KACC 23026]
MARTCEVCGRVEERDNEEEDLYDVCEACTENLRHPEDTRF